MKTCTHKQQITHMYRHICKYMCEYTYTHTYANNNNERKRGCQLKSRGRHEKGLKEEDGSEGLQRVKEWREGMSFHFN